VSKITILGITAAALIGVAHGLLAAAYRLVIDPGTALENPYPPDGYAERLKAHETRQHLTQQPEAA
jgi:hypothetical protein